jgi:hypothetical protein
MLPPSRRWALVMRCLTTGAVHTCSRKLDLDPALLLRRRFARACGVCVCVGMVIDWELHLTYLSCDQADPLPAPPPEQESRKETRHTYELSLTRTHLAGLSR